MSDESNKKRIKNVENLSKNEQLEWWTFNVFLTIQRFFNVKSLILR
jgi:hypothetical protein